MAERNVLTDRRPVRILRAGFLEYTHDRILADTSALQTVSAFRWGTGR